MYTYIFAGGTGRILCFKISSSALTFLERLAQNEKCSSQAKAYPNRSVGRSLIGRSVVRSATLKCQEAFVPGQGVP